MPPSRHWTDLTDAQRRGIVGAGTVQVLLLVAALVSIRRTPAERVRGPKWAWTLGAFVNWIGPLSWFAVGRRRQ